MRTNGMVSSTMCVQPVQHRRPRNLVVSADSINGHHCGIRVQLGQHLDDVNHTLAPSSSREGVLEWCRRGLNLWSQLLTSITEGVSVQRKRNPWCVAHNLRGHRVHQTWRTFRLVSQLLQRRPGAKRNLLSLQSLPGRRQLSEGHLQLCSSRPLLHIIALMTTPPPCNCSFFVTMTAGQQHQPLASCK